MEPSAIATIGIYLLKGAGVTIALAFGAIVLSVVAGLALAICRLYGPWPLRIAGSTYTFLVRGVPLLILLVAGYFCLPYFGLDAPAWLVGILVIGLYFAAYTSEIFRAAISAIPKTQWDAGRSLGFRRWDVFRVAVLPQTLRFCAAPIINVLVMVVKGTSLVSAIGAWELVTAATEVSDRTFIVLPVYLAVAAIYFVICFSLSRAAREVERRFTHA
jgi:His/Glu/Gln/Arg/opine family amino acid ABC transporter permease subunit